MTLQDREIGGDFQNGGRVHRAAAMTLIAPDHLRGRMSKWTPKAVRDERAAWALEAGRAGHTSYAVAEALGISQHVAWTLMHMAGWRWHDQPRDIRRGARGDA